MHSPVPTPGRRFADASRSLVTLSLTVVAVVALLAGCGEPKKDKPATQTAAKVNKEEITVHQIGFLMSQQRAVPPDQAASATRQVLERLIDQQLALEKASEQKLDREPAVVQRIEAARREIISRAYLDKVAAGAPKPTPAEISAFYEAHPGLFKNRRVYSLQEVNVQAKPEQIDAIKVALTASKAFTDFAAWLKANDYKFSANQAVLTAEQLPLASVDEFAQMKVGQAVFRAAPSGAQVINVAGIREEPVDAERAKPAIEQYLLNERKRKLMADDMKALRSSAKIEYVGDFAKDRPADPVEPKVEAPPLMSIAPAPQASLPVAAPQMEVAPIETAPASAPSQSTLDKGLKGFK